MPTMAVGPFGNGTESDNIGRGVVILVNGIADVFGIEGFPPPGGGVVGGVIGDVIENGRVRVPPPGGPFPVFPDPVRQAMAATDP